MNRNEKKKAKIFFAMFLYACGVSRVHEEFELFEQIKKKKKKNCANFKKKCCQFLFR